MRVVQFKSDDGDRHVGLVEADGQPLRERMELQEDEGLITVSKL